MNKIQGDLLTSNNQIFVHCISSDCALGAGIALLINNKYNIKSQLCKFYYPIGSVVKTKSTIDDKIIYNLVTKKNYWNKPSIGSLQICLDKLYDKCKILGITKLAMPRIGCGLDRLDWSLVKEYLIKLFVNNGIEIDVKFLADQTYITF